MENKPMKLYTEEQLHNTVIAVSNYLDDINLGRAQENIEKHLKALEPIELPSDEEINTESTKIMEEWYGSGCTEEIDAHFRGAKWMRDKIGGKNENI